LDIKEEPEEENIKMETNEPQSSDVVENTENPVIEDIKAEPAVVPVAVPAVAPVAKPVAPVTPNRGRGGRGRGGRGGVARRGARR